MAGLFRRLTNSIQADLHDALDKKEKKSPIAMLNQHVRRCEEETEKVCELVRRQAQLKDEFARELKEAERLHEKRVYQAGVADRAGEEELAQFAQKEATYYGERVEHIMASYQQTTKELSELDQKYEDMRLKVKDMHLRRMELMGRENMSRAHYRMNRVLEDADDVRTGAQFRETLAYLDRIEADVTQKYYQHSIDAKIAQLEKQSQAKELVAEK